MQIGQAQEERLEQKSLSEISPESQNELRGKLEERRVNLRRVLNESSSAKLTEEKKRGIERLVWVLTGILDHNLQLKQLLKLSKVYERQG